MNSSSLVTKNKDPLAPGLDNSIKGSLQIEYWKRKNTLFHCQFTCYSNTNLIQRIACLNRHRKIMEILLWSSAAALLPLCSKLHRSNLAEIWQGSCYTPLCRGHTAQPWKAVGSWAYGPFHILLNSREASVVSGKAALQIEPEALRWHFHCNCSFFTAIYETGTGSC